MNMHVSPQRGGAASSPFPPPSRTERLIRAAAFISGTLFMIWRCLGLLGNFSDLFSGHVAVGDAVGLAVNLWSIAAGVAVGLALLNPLRWLNGKRFAVGLTSAAVMLGSLGVSTIAALLTSLSGAGFGLISPLSPAFLITSIVGLALAPPLMLIFGAVSTLTVLGVLFGFVGFFLVVPMVLFRQVLEFENILRMYRYESRGLLGYIVRFIYWLRNQPLPKGLPDDSRGARFAEPEEIAALQCPQGMGFGHVEGEPLRIDTDKHVLIMASTRSGKGVALIIPQLLRHVGSAFVLDPKGENARATGRQRATLNDKVLYLDPFGISGKPQARFNPMSRLTLENMDAESKALAAALFVPGEGEKRDYWFERGLQLVALFIMFVFASDAIPANRKDLLTVRRLLLGKPKASLDAMKQVTDDDGTLSNLAQSFIDMNEKEFSSVVSVAQGQTAILDNPAMKACLAASGPGEEVDFKDWRRGTMTVYLCLSAPRFPVFNRWLRLVLTSALDEMTDILDPPPVPICFMLDELATLGHLPPIENAIGLAAGYGIQLVTVWQDIGQMKDLYKSRWTSFIGNSGVRALFNLDDFDSAKYWSNFIGGRIHETHSRQEDLYGLSSGQNIGEAVRPLITPEQLMLQFSKERMLVLPQGAHPVMTERKPYWEDSGLDGLWDDPRTPTQRLRSPMPPRPPQSPPPSSGPGTPPPSSPPSGGPQPSPETFFEDWEDEDFEPDVPHSPPQQSPSPQPAPAPSYTAQQTGWPGSYAPFGGLNAGAANSNQGGPKTERTLVRTEKAAGFTFHIYSDETVKITAADGAVRWSTVANLNHGRS
ncbi:type IV secretory system conjugative DNA transfer family protein [Methylocystis iwaonis]|uniref:Type IV secretory system conjugative DNA transfer family protein n=1 Tax=Methylocystis iwaonis TaxID=2885079 RepID=A0ABM8EF80_9HYPH|nr:type IV secretory system conjugative DNA transfer family protein [Methylocystis iwaonis]BDV36710.1 hypothetical protein SS37A_42400 [Methylocystis iwaonis]